MNRSANENGFWIREPPIVGLRWLAPGSGGRLYATALTASCIGKPGAVLPYSRDGQLRQD